MRSNQENRLKPYFAELEVNIKVRIKKFKSSIILELSSCHFQVVIYQEKLSIAEKRREEV